jgi:hypothetical protein
MLDARLSSLPLSISQTRRNHLFFGKICTMTATFGFHSKMSYFSIRVVPHFHFTLTCDHLTIGFSE